jgi:hypothetical protein
MAAAIAILPLDLSAAQNCRKAPESLPLCPLT